MENTVFPRGLLSILNYSKFCTGGCQKNVSVQSFQSTPWLTQLLFFYDEANQINLLADNTVLMCSDVQSCPTLWDPMDCSRQPLLFMRFSWQEYLSRVPFPPLGDLPDPGIKPESLGSPELAGRFSTNNATEKPTVLMGNIFPFRSFLYKCVNAKIKK